MVIKTKRIYEPATKTDGYRILVDRLWPRGMKKEAAQIDEWMKEVAPSTALRKWFNHEPEKWEEFVTKYKAELQDADAFKVLLAAVAGHKTVTLLYAAKDELYNQAIALSNFLKSNK